MRNVSSGLDRGDGDFGGGRFWKGQVEACMIWTWKK